MSKICVVGTGKLGSNIAYTAAQRGLADTVVLIDILKEMALGHAMDISQSVAYINDTQVVSGGYELLDGSDVVVVTAGKPRTPDMKDRLELAKVNAAIVSDVCANIRAHAPDCIVITCTNPMDLMNRVAFRALGFPQGKVIGFGGRLDGARLKFIVARHLKVSMGEVAGDVAGEHGEAMAPLFSRLSVKGKKKDLSDSEKAKIVSEVRGIALEIIKLKGITDFAPASCVCDIIEAILEDSQMVVPCSMNLSGEYGHDGVSIGVPVRLGRKGAEIVEWRFSADEKRMFDEGAVKLKGIVGQLGL